MAESICSTEINGDVIRLKMKFFQDSSVVYDNIDCMDEFIGNWYDNNKHKAHLLPHICSDDYISLCRVAFIDKIRFDIKLKVAEPKLDKMFDTFVNYVESNRLGYGDRIINEWILNHLAELGLSEDDKNLNDFIRILAGIIRFKTGDKFIEENLEKLNELKEVFFNECREISLGGFEVSFVFKWFNNNFHKVGIDCIFSSSIDTLAIRFQLIAKCSNEEEFFLYPLGIVKRDVIFPILSYVMILENCSSKCLVERIRKLDGDILSLIARVYATTNIGDHILNCDVKCDWVFDTHEFKSDLEKEVIIPHISITEPGKSGTTDLFCHSFNNAESGKVLYRKTDEVYKIISDKEKGYIDFYRNLDKFFPNEGAEFFIGTLAKQMKLLLEGMDECKVVRYFFGEVSKYNTNCVSHSIVTSKRLFLVFKGIEELSIPINSLKIIYCLMEMKVPGFDKSKPFKFQLNDEIGIVCNVADKSVELQYKGESEVFELDKEVATTTGAPLTGCVAQSGDRDNSLITANNDNDVVSRLIDPSSINSLFMQALDPQELNAQPSTCIQEDDYSKDMCEMKHAEYISKKRESVSYKDRKLGRVRCTRINTDNIGNEYDTEHEGDSAILSGNCLTQ